MQMFEGVEVAFIHGNAFIHDDFTDEVAIVAPNDKRAIGGHDPSVTGSAPSLRHCTYVCTRVVNLRVNANLAYESGAQKFRYEDNTVGAEPAIERS